jgi:predicted HTH domain antitoxin
MSKVAFEIEVPNVLRGTPLELKFVETARQVIQERTVIRLFEQGEVSSGYAASLLGLTKHDFIELLARNNVPFFNFTDDEWQEELENIASADAQLKAEKRRADDSCR